jgi:hypothetical protein
LPFILINQPAEEAEDEFREACEKGINLGPQRWPNAAHYFSEASKDFATISNSYKAAEA